MIDPSIYMLLALSVNVIIYCTWSVDNLYISTLEVKWNKFVFKSKSRVDRWVDMGHF